MRRQVFLGSRIRAAPNKDAIVAKSTREAIELWTVRDSPGEWQRTPHWPQLGFDVSVPTGEIHALMREIDAELRLRWPELKTVYFGHVADGIGLLKRNFLHYSRSPEELALMRAIKRAMDPNGILNPGKIL